MRLCQTSKAECTADAACKYSKGKVVFASGSPYMPVAVDDKTFVPGQGNNVYIFPGIGLAAISVEPIRLPDSVFLISAAELARLNHQSDFGPRYIVSQNDNHTDNFI